MASWSNLTVTILGAQKLAQASTNSELRFTRVVAGDGSLGDSELPESQTILKNQLISVHPSSIKATDNKVEVTAPFGSQLSGLAFDLREIGVYARVGNESEFLIAYGNAGDNAEHIDATGNTSVERVFKLVFSFSSEATVSLTTAPEAYVTHTDWATEMTIELSDANHPKYGGFGLVALSSNQVGDIRGAETLPSGVPLAVTPMLVKNTLLATLGGESLDLTPKISVDSVAAVSKLEGAECEVGTLHAGNVYAGSIGSLSLPSFIHLRRDNGGVSYQTNGGYTLENIIVDSKLQFDLLPIGDSHWVAKKRLLFAPDSSMYPFQIVEPETSTAYSKAFIRVEFPDGFPAGVPSVFVNFVLI